MLAALMVRRNINLETVRSNVRELPHRIVTFPPRPYRHLSSPAATAPMPYSAVIFRSLTTSPQVAVSDAM